MNRSLGFLFSFPDVHHDVTSSLGFPHITRVNLLFTWRNSGPGLRVAPLYISNVLRRSAKRLFSSYFIIWALSVGDLCMERFTYLYLYVLQI